MDQGTTLRNFAKTVVNLSSGLLLARLPIPRIRNVGCVDLLLSLGDPAGGRTSVVHRSSMRFGTTHFCAACHDDFQRLVCLPRNQFPPCPAGPRATPAEGPCPLRQPHPPPGEEFALGCGICRNISTF
ncbi:hypothetical protein RB195_015193 [Necator americanus]|uniref:Uncharacterized protein n=1 Tax=Necator americanus TaxID=51031 RepID=A0ABR1E4M7_NECAM